MGMSIQKPKEKNEDLTDQVSPQKDEPVDDSIVLELNVYHNYNFQGRMYEKGKPYRFSRMDGLKLMAELDHGTQVWKMYSAPHKAKPVFNEVVDATNVHVHGTEPIHGIS